MSQLPEEKKDSLPSEKKIPSRRHWRRYIFLTLLVLAMIASVIIYRFAEKPAEGTINNSTQDTTKAVQVNDVPNTFTSKGSYLSFMYGNTYVLKSDEVSKDNSAVILEQAYLSEPGGLSKKISLVVRSLPSQNLTDDPDYLMRENNPTKYKKENFFADGVSGAAFVPADNSQFMKTYFIQHSDKLAVLSVISPSSEDKTLDNEADAVAGSLAWTK